MAKQRDFEIGDLVVLKSGGPIMTVNGEGPSYKLQCVWFAGKKQESAFFSADALLQAPKGDTEKE